MLDLLPPSNAECISRWQSIETIETRFRRNVRVGMTKAQVDDYLRRCRVDAHYDVRTKAIYIGLRWIKGSFLAEKSAHMIVRFGADGRVSKVEVDSVFTFL